MVVLAQTIKINKIHTKSNLKQLQGFLLIHCVAQFLGHTEEDNEIQECIKNKPNFIYQLQREPMQQLMETEQKRPIIPLPFTKLPSPAERYIVLRNLEQLTNMIIKDISDFQNSALNKLKSLQQLKHIIYLAAESIQLFVEPLIKVLCKIYQNESGMFQQEKIKLIAQCLGGYIDAEIYLHAIIKLCQDEELKTNTKYVSNYLLILSFLLLNENASTIGDQFENIVHFMQQMEFQHLENPEVMFALFEVIYFLVHSNHQGIPIYARQMFSIVISIQSIPNLPQNIIDRSQDCLQSLAKCCGYVSIGDLHTNEVNIFLDEIIQTKSYEKWKKGGRDVNKFQIIVQGCNEGIVKYLEQVIRIMGFCVQPSQEVELRMDMLILMEQIVRIDSITESLKLYSYEILNRIILPCMTWRAGKPQIKIRKGAVINTILILERGLITPKEIDQLFGTLVGPLKSCLTDDWAPDLRFASVRLTQQLLLNAKGVLSNDSLRDFYPTMLERLDDSQDPIRIEMANAIGIFFQCSNLSLSPSILEYIIKAILIHLDDQNEKVQRAVFDSLKVAAAISPDRFIKEAEPLVKNFKYPRACQELIKYARSLEITQEEEGTLLDQQQ